LDLISGLEKSGRNVTCDNFFTSISLARELPKRQMTLLGTIRKNKGELPTKLTETRDRQENTSIFAFQDSATLVSYCPKKGRVVVLLSTEHDTAEVDNSNPEWFLIIMRRKPEWTQWTRWSERTQARE